MHVAVIGAGAAGLCAARHLSAASSGFTCVVFEQTASIGGTWVYTERTGCDQYGLPICSAMYKNLRTNLGKETMEFPGFPLSHPKSFVPAGDVLQYLKDFTNHYGLEKHIRFLSHVKRVTPKDERWAITVVDLPTNQETVTEFDAVVVCNGHYSLPYRGECPGLSVFGGEVSHSHCYREPEPYTGRAVLLCGAGPSGVDIVYDLAPLATQIYLSHKYELKQELFPENVKLVPVVQEVKKDHVVFEDGTSSGHIDAIILCTGYLYSFPFLTPECGITVDEGKFVRPLYKHIININQPTMGFIGLPFRSFVIPLFDHQVCFFLKTLCGEVKLPSKEDMMSALNFFIKQKQEGDVPLRKYFYIGDSVKAYLDDLAEIGRLEPIPPVVYRVYQMTGYLRKNYLPIYRDAVFEVIDRHNFKVTGVNIPEGSLDPNQVTTQLAQVQLKE